MSSYDAVGLPELHWTGAIQGQRVLGQALGECVESGELSAAEAEAAGEAILRGNARRLYRLFTGGAGHERGRQPPLAPPP